jgi:hypothetical protein
LVGQLSFVIIPGTPSLVLEDLLLDLFFSFNSEAVHPSLWGRFYLAVVACWLFCVVKVSFRSFLLWNFSPFIGQISFGIWGRNSTPVTPIGQISFGIWVRNSTPVISSFISFQNLLSSCGTDYKLKILKAVHIQDISSNYE